MNWIIQKIVRLFFNTFYKIRPPESVQYWKYGESARAKVIEGEDGSLQMHIEGEKYPLYGFPRGHVLTNGLARLKKMVKDRVFNEVFSQIEKIYEDQKYDVMPIEKCAPAIREMARVFDILENMEIQDDMKGRIRLIKKVILFFLTEDDAYRARAQMFLSLIDQKKVEMSKEDLYYARGKYFKPDYMKKILGKWIRAYDY